MNFFVLPNTKEDILKKVCNQAVLGHHWLPYRKKKYYGSQWCPRTALFPRFFRISSFVFSRTKTFIQGWNYLRVSKWWQNFYFWMNYPFNVGGLTLEKWCVLTSFRGWNKIHSDDRSCLFHAITSKEEEMIGSHAAWTEALQRSVTTHERATKWYLLFEFCKNWQLENWDFVSYQK